MSDDKIYDIAENFAANAWIDEEKYQAMYARSVQDPEGFWADQAGQFLTWFSPWDKVLEWDFHTAKIRWFEGGKLNACYNCVDRHLETRGDQVALIWEADDPATDKRITYRELYEQVCRLANVLKRRGIAKGDRVCIYMPMIPEACMAMLACARIGGVRRLFPGIAQGPYS
jgi:acetyl-CoA synthetase